MTTKIELGGGVRPIRSGFLNLDLLESADIQIDLEAVGRCEQRLPFDDDCVSDVFSSHCLEHVSPYRGLLRELARVCHIGARLLIIVPHWNQSMAMCAGHKHTISEQQVAHWFEFPDVWWGTCVKRLDLLETKYVPGRHFEEARQLFPQLTDEQIFHFIADTCHEIHFHFTVSPATIGV